MPYRRPGRMSVLASQRQASRGQSLQKSYVSQQSGAKRHQYTSLPIGTPVSLTAGLYFYFVHLAFGRSEGGGASDTPFPPTASNNYQTHVVFNGSRVTRYNNTM